jgi:amino-acid N-acetyltransferase
MRGYPTVRKACLVDVPAIADLVNGYAAADVMLPRKPEQVALSLDDYVVATDTHGRLLACAALREYSPSLAELVSVAVAREAHGRGLGRLVVAAVERLATKRGFASIFAHTLTPTFFESIGYEAVDRELYPEKCARAQTTCLRRVLLGDGVARLASAA